MAFEDFLDHRCTVYHIQKSSGSLGYGVEEENLFVYPDSAEEKDRDLPCHFAVKSGNPVVSQNDPLNQYDGRIKLTLPCGTDIRMNDKVVSAETGFSYIAEIPRNIRNHHLTVWVHRQGGTKGAL